MGISYCGILVLGQSQYLFTYWRNLYQSLLHILELCNFCRQGCRCVCFLLGVLTQGNGTVSLSLQLLLQFLSLLTLPLIQSHLVSKLRFQRCSEDMQRGL
ncbi:hypothetical protein FKM82_024839 [Ascaphus truei]